MVAWSNVYVMSHYDTTGIFQTMPHFFCHLKNIQTRGFFCCCFFGDFLRIWQQMPLIWGTEKDVHSSTESGANPREHVWHWYSASLKKNLVLQHFNFHPSYSSNYYLFALICIFAYTVVHFHIHAGMQFRSIKLRLSWHCEINPASPGHPMHTQHQDRNLPLQQNSSLRVISEIWFC